MCEQATCRKNLILPPNMGQSENIHRNVPFLLGHMYIFISRTCKRPKISQQPVFDMRQRKHAAEMKKAVDQDALSKNPGRFLSKQEQLDSSQFEV
jgi:hypothetical protein